MAETDAQLSDPAEWLDKHGNYLFRYALYRLGDPSIAEELVQETFIAGLKGREGFSGRSTERTWLVGILKHKVIDHLRKLYRERSLIQSIEAEGSTDGEFNRIGHWVEGPSKWDVNPAEVANQKEFWDVLQVCLSALPEETARAYMMREVDGMETEEICKVLNITANNLWVRLHRARMALRRCLEKNWFADKMN